MVKLLRWVKLTLRFVFWNRLLRRKFRAPLPPFVLGRTTRFVQKSFILLRVAMIFITLDPTPAVSDYSTSSRVQPHSHYSFVFWKRLMRSKFRLSRVQPHSHYSLSELLKNPLSDYPSPMALYGMEPDGTILNLPISSANRGGAKGQKTFPRGENDPAICVLEAIHAKRVAGLSSFLYLEG